MPAVLKSSIIGIFIGILPGAGGDIASWVAYNMAKNSSKEPETFGKGNPIGICASEAANNAVTGGFLIQGMQPGRELFTTGAVNTYSIITGFTVANILMGIFGAFVAKHLIIYQTKPSSSRTFSTC